MGRRRTGEKGAKERREREVGGTRRGQKIGKVRRRKRNGKERDNQKYPLMVLNDCLPIRSR